MNFFYTYCISKRSANHFKLAGIFLENADLGFNLNKTKVNDF